MNGSSAQFRYTYRVLLPEPVMQGILTPSSSLYVLAPPEGTEAEDDETPTQSIYRSRAGSFSDGGFFDRRIRDKGVDRIMTEGEDEGDEQLEIDASFLANSLPPLPSPSLPTSISLSSSLSTLVRAPVEYLPLPAPWTSSSESVFLRAEDLARSGVFSGDWVLLSSPSAKILARAFASDNIPPGPAVLLSPSLLHFFPPTHALDPPPTLRLLSTPFQSLPPPLPIAQSVTLARVPSPASTSKRFQPLFLRALKKLFKDKRLIRQGQVLAVVVNKDDRALLREKEDGEVDDQLLDYEFPFPSSSPDTPVYFKITNIVYDPPSSSAQADTYTLATLGELGCWFDPSQTRMVQSGVEHSLVPAFPLPLPPALPTAPTSPYPKLLQLAAACLSPSALDYQLQLTVLLRGPRGVGKRTTALAVAQRLGMHVLDVNCYELVGESEAVTEGTLRARFESAAACAPCVLLLRNLEALARTSQVLEQGREPSIATALRECVASLPSAWQESQFPVILLASSSEGDKIPLSIQACFKHEINFDSPDEVERLEILRALLKGERVAADVELREIAAQSAALVAKDLVDLVGRAKLGALERATKELVDEEASIDDIEDAGIALSGTDFTSALAESRASYSESIGAPKIPNVSWDDVGGLAEVKADILDTIQLPLEHPELFADGLKKRSGILLYGPPGTGKTLLAKAVATSCSLNFFSVKGPELLNMYIGESEANVRRVFQRARDARPCVIFFDELDSVAPKRGNHGDSGGVMDRIVSQLLAELDGMSDETGSAEVFVIGATNRPDLLDPALLRPGRFDRMLYLGVCTTHEAQLKILQALTRKFRLDPSLDLMRVAEQCPFNYTGADFYALCSDAMLKAMTRKAEEVDAKIAEWNEHGPVDGHPHPMTPQYYLAELAKPEDTDFLVSQRDFEAALAELVPSVSTSEMDHYAIVQKNESGSKRQGQGQSQGD
ncbi:AAA-domain-containing protein [Dacryopinax primogenitus]|uniref:Peroxisomal ATPase PEX6 n=1 Tax=Dacryopinax primogenitus (strain DJM 731) TaxID=1858805 RepID=M5GA26_DACPD|nr:AAA-domain-containing protein [Dacryopinax primogenitus]EJU05669.1 AAA-domain-containing protein [Dacryopinax primogenitus]